MLQQILNDMYIDPELLAELDDDQKQTLFCKMREEQVRRWQVREEQLERESLEKKLSTPPAAMSGMKKVTFLLGTDGNPWVWVMGEHSSDKSIEEILEEEEQEKARKQAEQEAEKLRVEAEEELVQLLNFNQQQVEEMEKKRVEEQLRQDEEVLYNSIQGAQQEVQKMDQNQGHVCSIKEQKEKENGLQKKRQNQNRVSKQIALWEGRQKQLKDQTWERVKEKRASEIFNRLQLQRQRSTQEAQEASPHQERIWQEQEKKAKEAERQIREIARRAREEHRRTSSTSSLPPLDLNSSLGDDDAFSWKDSNGNLITAHTEISSLDPSRQLRRVGCIRQRHRPPKPPTKETIIDWFREEEQQRGAGLDPATGKVAIWFHGIITRQAAESLLNMMPIGSFLVRVSERIWGYAVSYKATDRCKHYLIDASDGRYCFFGSTQVCHTTLDGLVKYHMNNPITSTGQEYLHLPCPQQNGTPDYLELFTGVENMKL